MTNRDLKRHGMRYGAYHGARRRRHCLFVADGANEWRHEFDTRREAMAKAASIIASRKAST